MITSDLTEAVLEKIRAITRVDQEEFGTPMTCESTSKHVRDAVLPWSLREGGYYLGPDIYYDEHNDTDPLYFEPGISYDDLQDKNYQHHWLRLEDGTIVDPTANQFGDPNIVRLIPADDPRQAWYVLVIEQHEKHSNWHKHHPAALAFAASRRLGLRRAGWV